MNHVAQRSCTRRSLRENLKVPSLIEVSIASLTKTQMRRALSLLLIATACAAPSTQATRPQSPRWLATWTASPYDAGPRPPRDSVDRVPRLFDQTLRLVVRTSIGGERVRIRLSNEYGDRPLVIDAAHIAVRDSGTSIVPATDRALTFGRR